MDKTGEFVQEKNYYCNPLKGQEHFCLFTALVCYLSVHQEHLSCTENIFINPGAELHTASQSFGRQISKMTKRYADVIRNFCHLSHFNIHGLRKGVAFMQPLSPLVLLFSHRLQPVVSGPWKKSWVSIFNLQQVEIFISANS